jgi:ABC-type phosphate/phosphonate transport system substrate-binding protein
MHKFIIHILLSFLFIISLFSQSPKESKPEIIKTIKLIISSNSFHNLKTEDAQAVAQILANHIKQTHNLDYDFIVETPESIPDIEKSAKNDFDFIILTTEEYLNLYKKLPLEPFVTNYSAGHLGYKYYFVVNKNDGVNDISELKNETITVLSRQNQKAAFLWLDKLLKDNGLSNQKKYLKDVIADYKATNVLLPVFFKKAKACIVTEMSLNLLSELNPGIKNETKILYSSDYILLGLGCMNSKKINTATYNLLKEIIPTLHTTEYGKQLLKLFNADKLVLFKDEYLQNYLKLIIK